MKAQEFKEIFNHIERDFVPGEYAPYDVLHQQLQNGVQEGLILCEGEQDVAYSICAGGHANGYVLISLLAVFEEFRGCGIGPAFLKELHRIYSNKQGIIVEVEKPENSQNQEVSASSAKRIGFYEKAGFYLIPNISYSIWDVPMHLMVLFKGYAWCRTFWNRRLAVNYSS
jgi:GNAT superfamily N-acetyltransferase